MVAVLGCVAAGVVGCGGGGGGGQDTPQPGDAGVSDDVGVPETGESDGTDTALTENPGDPGGSGDPGEDPPLSDWCGTDDGSSGGEEHLDIPADAPCHPPSFPENCSLVTEFQCGFAARCEKGTLHAEWHHHWFCDGEEEITPFQCSYACPHGCEEGEIVDWPQDGQALVEEYCNECSQPSDCHGLEHPMCEGYWVCEKGKCSWKCDAECVPEGGSVPVVPNAPKCCPGLVQIPCDAPNVQGECQACVGASLCTYCGDARCGPGENVCNCPSDCTGACLGLGGRFMDFETEGRCCEGLVPVDDCVPAGEGCACPDCPCHICLPCGDGVCGPFENECNCPADCPVEECVGEGGSIPVIPDPPKCCPGLVKVPCHAPDEKGECLVCVGATLCTKCGDGQCGKGENLCNCPADCGGECLGLGETFLSFHTAGKCCAGLQAMPDCHIGTNGGCSCPKCPCYICLPCGDGVCDPFEHLCNCAQDCPTADKCVPTKKSECLGNPYGAEPAGKLTITVEGHDILLRHEAVVLNCCLETVVCFTPRPDIIEVVERQSGGPPCFCQCLFNIEATLKGIRTGTYDLTLYNEEQGKVLFQEVVKVP